MDNKIDYLLNVYEYIYILNLYVYIDVMYLLVENNGDRFKN